MHTAFSRPSDITKKQYVQQLLEEEGETLRHLILRQGAHVYVCGDASRMAKDVFATMSKLLSQDPSFVDDVNASEGFLRGLKAEKRWLEDVW